MPTTCTYKYNVAVQYRIGTIRTSVVFILVAVPMVGIVSPYGLLTAIQMYYCAIPVASSTRIHYSLSGLPYYNLPYKGVGWKGEASSPGFRRPGESG